MNTKTIVFTAENTAELLDYKRNDVTDNDVAVKTFVSTISCGTERALITGNPNVNANGAARGPENYYPVLSGYSSAGTVIETGRNVKNVKVGDRVVVYRGHHCAVNVVDCSQVVKIEDDNITFSDGGIKKNKT